MKGLLPQNVLNDILTTTGAVPGTKVQHIIQGKFKPYNFYVRKKKEFELALLDSGFERMGRKIQRDWKINYLLDVVFKKEKLYQTDFKGYTFREKSFCAQVNSRLTNKAYFIYLGVNTFYYVLNKYLGGGKLNSHKKTDSFTEIEKDLFHSIVDSICEVYSTSFNYIAKQDLVVTDYDVDEEYQRQEFNGTYFVTDLSFEEGSEKYAVSFAAPSEVLEVYERYLEKEHELESRRLDPIWKRVVMNAFLNTELNLKVKLGTMDMTFGNVAKLRPGDNLDWEKKDTDITVIYENEPRISGTLGVLGDDYAIKVKSFTKR